MSAWVLNFLSLVKVHLCGSALLATQHTGCSTRSGWRQPCHHHPGAPGLLCTHRHQLHTNTVSWLSVWSMVSTAERSQRKVTVATASLPDHLTWNAHVRWPQAVWALWVSCLCPRTLHTKHSWTVSSQLSRFVSSNGDGCYSKEITMIKILCLNALGWMRCKLPIIWSHSGVMTVWHQRATLC